MNVPAVEAQLTDQCYNNYLVIISKESLALKCFIYIICVLYYVHYQW